jgi:hypothetical protein
MQLKALSMVIVTIAAIILTSEGTSSAFDTHQSSGHNDDDNAPNVSGSATINVSPYNTSYAARPDNSGLALFMYRGHVDADLYGAKFFIPVDVNLFTDGTQHGARIFRPSELDFVGGLATRWNLRRVLKTEGYHFEASSNIETQMPMDRSGFTQLDSDVRTSLFFSGKDAYPNMFSDNTVNVSGHFMLAWNWWNPCNPSRPNNTGSELFSYEGALTASALHDRIGMHVLTTFFTNRDFSNAAKAMLYPTELDLTIGISSKISEFWRPKSSDKNVHSGGYSLEWHLEYERDMQTDNSPQPPPPNNIRTQSFMYTGFTLKIDPQDKDRHDSD